MTCRTSDFALVRAVLTHPTQWSAATDDSAPAMADFRPNEDERIIYLDVDGAAIFTLIPQNAVCFEIHAAVLPRAWGASTAMLKSAIAWAFQNTPAARIVASIPATNRLAIALAKRAGLEQHGANPRSFLKGGVLVDQILLGISKPEETTPICHPS